MKRIFIGLGILALLIISVSVPTAAFATTKTPKDTTPPKLTALHIQSNNANPASAKTGDKVTISLTASEKVTPIVLVESRTLFAKSINTSGNSWEESYTVDPRDPSGKVDYIITLTDASNNIYICTSFKLPIQIVPRCLTTDGSSVTVVKTPAPDTQAPVIAPHVDIAALGTASGATVTYANPTATDNVDSSVAVACTPVSGSLFSVGNTTVTCTAHDAAGNNATPTTFKVVVSVPPPTDTEAPVIAPHENISVAGPHLNQSVAVTYTNPGATDNVDSSVAVSCAPSSGSTFAFGTTTVTCTAHDAAGNNATPTTFDVGVYFIPQPYTMATQADESFFCTPDWQSCFTGSNGTASINLGQGSTLGDGTLKSITIAESGTHSNPAHPWTIELDCFTDSAYTTICPDWVKPQAWNGLQANELAEFADQNPSSDKIHWTADFTDPTHAANGDSSSPVVFNPSYYYRMVISDNLWTIEAYGSQSLSLPYYLITGMTK